MAVIRAGTKRAFDLVVAGLALVLLSPFMGLIAIAVRLDSPGPALYRQTRVGRGGRPFTLLKFRSMVRDADRLAANVSPSHDPRVTRLGRALRACYLDELPQLVNVFVGTMSLVGPRPETPEFVELYTPIELGVLSVRPGIVGPSTLAYMHEPELLASSVAPEDIYVAVVLHERVRLDLEYVGSHSLLSDIRLMYRQLLAILRKVRS
jgi:lipopolysaccharide/colanic/teichoic acid biosynthesis glycosyltransferase